MTDPPTSTQPNQPPLRQCGRCRLFVPASGELHAAELKEWWACDDCSALITPSHRRIPAHDGPATADGPA